MAHPWLEAAPDLAVSYGELFDRLFAAAALKPGERVLDVGCGTGPTLLPAAQAVGDRGAVLGVDISPPLVARAREGLPDNVTVVAGDAAHHDFEAGAFDAIISNFGIMFFADSAAAFRNLRHAVLPGGRLVASVWGAPQDNPWFSMPRRIVDDHVSDVPRPDPSGPGPMRFADLSVLAGFLEEAGWNPDIRTLDIHLTPPGDAVRVAELHMKITVGMMLAGMDVPADDLERIRGAVSDALQAYENDGAIEVPARIHLVSAIAR